MSAVMRMSALFLRTLRDDPADAEVASHRLLVRAGYVRRVSPGVFAWLPLGWRVLRKVEGIVRDEMDAAGFQEIHLPALLPREPYERTGRWTEYGDDLFRLHDRRGADHLLGPTHEELFTLLVADVCSSYRDLPLVLYQIQTKYRDEVRPRAGILRGREFLMKDSYSFDLDDEGLAAAYQHHRSAYQRTFERLGLEHVIVEATSGAMGGSASEEFLAICDAGEDTFVRCDDCGHAANVEAITTPVPKIESPTDLPEARVLDTPATATVAALVNLMNEREDLRRDDRPWVSTELLKNLLVVLRHPDGRTEPLAVGVPGDREVDLRRLGAAVAPAEVQPFTGDDFAAHPGLVKGYVGPEALGTTSPTGIRYLTDPRVVDGTVWVSGANQPDRHAVLVAGRDFSSDGVADVAEVRDGDPCPRCGGLLSLARGIEIGHIFQLGRKYAKALDLAVVDDQGARVTPTMGSYGIGVSRAVAAIAEQTHDEQGLCWPRSVAPFDVHVVAAGKTDEAYEVAGSVATDLTSRGLEVLLDDRRESSPGVKFNDAELIGIPTIVIAGRGLVDGLLEVRDRVRGETADVAIADLVSHLVHLGLPL